MVLIRGKVLATKQTSTTEKEYWGDLTLWIISTEKSQPIYFVEGKKPANFELAADKLRTNLYGWLFHNVI